MSEDEATKDLNGAEPTKAPTEQLTDRQILLELRQAVAGLTERLMRLEVRFEGRDTNPLLPPNFAERFAALDKEVRLTNRKLDKLALDTLETHARQQDLTERVEALESKPH